MTIEYTRSYGSLACHTYCIHWTSVYNDHPRGPVTLTSFADRLAVELSPLSPPVCQLRYVAPGISTPNLPLAGPTLYPIAPPPLVRTHKHPQLDLLLKLKQL